MSDLRVTDLTFLINVSIHSIDSAKVSELAVEANVVRACVRARSRACVRACVRAIRVGPDSIGARIGARPTSYNPDRH